MKGVTLCLIVALAFGSISAQQWDFAFEDLFSGLFATERPHTVDNQRPEIGNDGRPASHILGEVNHRPIRPFPPSVAEQADSRPQTLLRPRPEDRPESGFQSEPNRQPQGRPQTGPFPVFQPQPNTRPEVRPQPFPAFQTKPNAWPEVQPKPQPQPNAGNEVRPQPGPFPGSQSQPSRLPEVRPQPQPQLNPGSQPQPQFPSPPYPNAVDLNFNGGASNHPGLSPEINFDNAAEPTPKYPYRPSH